MTPNEINLAIAEVLGTADRWVILKRGYFYRPDAHGYTNKESEAWIVSESVANEHVNPHDEPVSKRRATPIDYYGDLNAIAKAVQSLPGFNEFPLEENLHRYNDYLVEVCGSVNNAFNASSEQRCEAFLKLKRKWK